MLLLQYTIGMKFFRNQNPEVNQLGCCVVRIMIFSNRLSFERFSSVVTHVNERWTRKRRHEIEPRRSAIAVDSFVIRGNEIIISRQSIRNRRGALSRRDRQWREMDCLNLSDWNYPDTMLGIPINLSRSPFLCGSLLPSHRILLLPMPCFSIFLSLWLVELLSLYLRPPPPHSSLGLLRRDISFGTAGRGILGRSFKGPPSRVSLRYLHLYTSLLLVPPVFSRSCCLGMRAIF